MHKEFDPNFLGRSVRVFRSNQTTVKVLYGTAVVCVLVIVTSCVMAYNRYTAPPSILDEMSFGASARRSAVFNACVISGFSLIVAIGCVGMAEFQKSVKLIIHQNGFLYVRGRQEQKVSWPDILLIHKRKDITRTYGANYNRRVVRWYIDVHRRHGDVVTIGALEDMHGAADELIRLAAPPDN